MVTDRNDILKAASLIREGKLVAIPTETVYGLAADATNDRAVAEIYDAKGRPHFNPLIVHVADKAMAAELVEWTEQADKLAKAFWPGPLTLVLQRKKNCPLSLLVSAGLDTVGIRMPAHALTQALLKEANKPLAAPSANRSGRVSPTTAAHVREELGELVPMILDGGPCTVGIESTVLDMTGSHPVMLRPGAITLEQLSAVLSPVEIKLHSGEGPLTSPGLLKTHYAPSLPVRLNVTEPEPGEALLAFGESIPAGAAEVENLSPTGNLTEAAANLFAAMRRLDRPEFIGIAVMPIPNEGLGMAINDRLQRSAA